MSEPGRVDRGRSQEPTGPKKKKKVDDDSFKKMMKTQKVRETDPEQKKKGKHQAEVEEESKAKQTTRGDLQQGLDVPSKDPSIYQPSEKPETTIPDAPAPPSEPPPFFHPPSDEGKAITRADETKAPQPKKKDSTSPTKKHKKKKPPTEGVVPPKPPPAPSPPKKEKEESTEGLFAQVEKPEAKKEKKASKEAPIQAAPPPPPLPEGAWESTKEAEKKGKKVEEAGKGAGVQPELPPQTEMVPTSEPLPAVAPISSAFSHLPPQVQALCEKMVGVMTVMDTGGIKETTINLTGPQYKNSVFFGAQIIITEFSTAPKEYNIEMVGNQKAVDLISPNTNELVAAFQAGNYNFKVHRIDTSYGPSKVEGKKQARRVKRKKGS